MQLLDLSADLPGLKRLPGRKTWYPRDKVQFFDSWEQAEEVVQHSALPGPALPCPAVPCPAVLCPALP